MIRASNQVVPKNKVVDHLVLYNFYFGQISGFNVKIGVLGCQTLLKFFSNELNPVTVLSSEPYARPCRDPRRRRRRHASAVGDPRSPRGRVLSLLEATLPLSSPGSVSVFPSPSSSPSGSRRASRAELAAGAALAKPHRPASFPCAQCRASSPRTSSIHPRARTCPIPTESSRDRRPPLTTPSSSAPSRRVPLSGLPSLKSSRR